MTIKDSENFVSGDQLFDGPSCTTCGAAMVISEFKCLSCGTQTGFTDVTKIPAATKIPAQEPRADMFEVFERLAGRWEDPEDAYDPMPWPWRL